MLSIFLLFLLSASFAREISSTNALEASDLTNTEVPKCQGQDLEIKPLCRYSSSQGYLTLWEVRNNKAFRCREQGHFSQALEDKNLPEEWNPGMTKICGAYWSGNEKLSLSISETSAQMSLVKFSNCSGEQVKTIHSLCRLSVLPSTLQSFTASFHRDLKCVNVNFKTTAVDDDLTATIERSLDGNKFEALVSIPSTSKNEGQYSYFDCTAKKAGSYYYRIRQRDHKGTEKIYNTIQMLMPESVTELQLTSTAVKDELKVSVPTSKIIPLELTVYDLAGNMVEEKIAKLEPHHHVVNLKVRRYPSGTYILKVKKENQIQLGRFLKE
jgi:hypothetical protein